MILSGESLGGGRHANVVLGPVALPDGTIICHFRTKGRHKAERSLDGLVRIDDSLHHTIAASVMGVFEKGCEAAICKYDVLYI